MKKEDQFLKVEIRLADRILEQFKDEAFIVIQSNDLNLLKVKRLLGIKNLEISCNGMYKILPGEGMWPYQGCVTPCYYALHQFDPIPLIIGLEKIRTFLDEWNPDEDYQDLSA